MDDTARRLTASCSTTRTFTTSEALAQIPLPDRLQLVGARLVVELQHLRAVYQLD
jgi:hypothetical protein